MVLRVRLRLSPVYKYLFLYKVDVQLEALSLVSREYSHKSTVMECHRFLMNL